MKCWKLLTLWLCALSAGTNEASVTEKERYSVLMVSMPYAGHLLPMTALGEELVRRGHNATLCSTTMKGYELPQVAAKKAGMTFLDAGRHYYYTIEELNEANRAVEEQSVYEAIEEFITKTRYDSDQIESALNNPILRSWDVMIVDGGLSASTACYNRRWAIPLISLWLTASIAPSHLPQWPFPLILFPEYNDDLQFQDRLKITILKFILMAIVPPDVPIRGMNCSGSYEYAANAPGHHVPEILNSVVGHGFEFARPVSPLSSYVGPILTKQLDPLPGDLQSWLESRSPNSVVYISMGTRVYISYEIAQALIEGIMSTDFGVLWSLRESNQDVLSHLEIDTSRVYVKKWMPQLSVLNHTAVGIAVLHGGAGGVQEALFSGVPAIVIPGFSFEQNAISYRIQHFKLGVRLDRESLTAEKVANALKVVNSNDCRQAVAKLQKMYSMAGGVDKAANLVEFYTEYGYEHLVPAYAKYQWSWVQYYNVDVYALIFFTLLVCTYCLVRFCFCGFRFLCSRKAKTE